MSNTVAKQTVQPISAQILSLVILHGNLKDLTPIQKVEYYNKVCEVVGLNPLTKPFDYIVLNGKEVLYANKGCAEQLRQIHKISLDVTQVQTVEGVYIVMVKASDANGRHDSATGAIAINGLSGDALANAFMKCETKAKRRATLSICGLNMLDETEVASIPGDSAPPPPIAPPKVPPVVQPKTLPTRRSVAEEIMACQKAMNMASTELAEWALNKFGKDNLKSLTLEEMIDFRNELQNEMKGK